MTLLAPPDALVLPVESTPIADAAEMYALALPLAPVPLYGLRPDGRCQCGRANCIRSAGKHPIGDEWEKRTTLDLDVVRDRFRDHRGNIGLYLGSGRFVGIDADGAYGMETVATWQLPTTLQAQSGSGEGGHFILEYAAHQDPSRVTDRRVCPGVDVKSRGQFAVAPSRHKSGGVYRWVAAVPIATLPDDTYERICKRVAPKPTYSIPVAPRSDAETRARGWLKTTPPAIEGSDGSNATLYVCRGLMGWMRQGLSTDLAWALLLEHNAVCQPPWSKRELAHKWESAQNAHTPIDFEDRPPPVLRAISGGRSPARPVDSSSGSGTLPPDPPTGGSGGGRNNEPDWRSNLLWAEQRNGRPKLVSHVENVIRILQLDPRWAGRIRFDVFRSRITLAGAPWDDYQRPSTEQATWTDEDTTRLNAWLRREFHASVFAPTIQDCERAVPVVARTRDFNPVRDYLDSLEWDGVPRLSRWLHTYFGAEDNEYHRLVGIWWLISACARIYDPGCKVDTVPILEGRQGIRKSSALRVLFGAEFFNDTPIDIGHKDAYTAIQGCWCVELAELDSLMRAEPTRSKAFFSSGKDRFRRAYARHEREELRQCIFVGTTNMDEYLNDPTGGRRFWPIICLLIDLASIERDRDQLWAEAVHEYHEGRFWYPTAETEHVLLVDVQEGRTKVDAWETDIASFLSICVDGQTTVTELLRLALKLDPKDWTQSAQTRVGAIMANKFRGWPKRRVTVETGPDCRRIWAYVRDER